MWLRPDSQPPAALKDLQAELEKSFPGFDDLSEKSEEKEVNGKIREFEASWKAIEFTVSHIYFISREADEPFEPRVCVPISATSLPPAFELKPRIFAGAGGRLFVGNLSFDVTDEDLVAFFREFRPLRGQISKDRTRGWRSKGFGFVEFASREDAVAAIAALNGKELKGRSVNVKEAREKEAE